jgi:CO/xanthine dehydrogenase FAD-binding subunit
MISEYFRPASVSEAVALLTDKDKLLKPLGGGTSLSRKQEGQFGVVDLQSAGVDQIIVRGQKVTAGAMVRLEDLLSHPGIHTEIKRAIRIDASSNIRHAASLGGWLVSGEGRSIISTVLLALDAVLTWEPDTQEITLGDWLPIRKLKSAGVLLTEIGWGNNPDLAFEYVARSPKDRPTLIVAIARWNSGRTRVALGGFGESPIVAMDGPESSGVDVASRDAYFEAGDQWATALYRREVAAKLALRCLDRIDAYQESEA